MSGLLSAAVQRLKADLANDADPAKGVAVVAGAARVVDSVATVRNLPKTGAQWARTIAHTAGQTGGGALYWLDPTDTTTADDGASVLVATDGGRWKLAHSGRVNAWQFGVLPTEKGAADPVATAAALETLRLFAAANKARVEFPEGTYVLPAGVRLDASNSEWVFAPGAVLKLRDTQESTDFLTFSAPVSQRVIGLRVDGNRAVQNAATFGADHSAVLVVDANGCWFEATTIVSSPAKGFAIVSSVGNTTKDTHVTGFSGGNCATQCLIVDGNNMGGFFDRVTINGVRIGATGHAGVALNDGASSITLSDVIADVQNSTWDAIAIRDSFDIQLSNVRGKRGRNGVYLQRSAGFCGRIQLHNVIGELSSQEGVLLSGVENVTGSNVTGRNNAGAGIEITQTAGAYRCKNINIANPVGYDDQGVHTQQYGILVNGVDGCRLGKHTAYGNTTKDISIARATTSDVEANVRQVVSGTTGSIAASSQAVVTLNWPAQFDDASIDIEAANVAVGTSSLALCVGHVVAVTQAAVQVMVKNLSTTTAFTGTLSVIGVRQK